MQRVIKLKAMSKFEFENITPINLKSVVTCPVCGHKKEETMPEDSCQFFYECMKCHAVLKPKKGDCCVYCSYGTENCPSIQAGGNCC